MRERRLANERLSLTVLPGLGCHWGRLQLALEGQWVDVLHRAPDRFTLERAPMRWGSFLLAPWSNRITGPTFEHEGQRYRLYPSFPDGTAIHGDVRERSWTVQHASATELVAGLDTRHYADFNFPFAIRFEHTVRLEGSALRCTLHALNVDEVRVPMGLGFHPYFRRQLTGADDDVHLTVPAERVYPAEQCIPTGPPVAVEGRCDLRGAGPLGARRLDDCFTGLSERRVRLAYPGSGVALVLEPDPGFDHLVVFSPGADSDFVAVEPVSHANDGFNLASRGWRGTGVRHLAPGERWGGGFTLRVEPLG